MKVHINTLNQTIQSKDRQLQASARAILVLTWIFFAIGIATGIILNQPAP